ncbi:hypothetical protein [Nocardia sp. N2S4-5]|uniref:hypothetical protein n=1 Tax=Nocardia sp. N2S4-5 TaxID=3351565 RepID=UPI0037CDE551
MPVLLAISVCCLVACKSGDSGPGVTTVPTTNSVATVVPASPLATVQSSRPARPNSPGFGPPASGSGVPAERPAPGGGDELPPTAVISPGKPVTGAGIPTSVTPLPPRPRSAEPPPSSIPRPAPGTGTTPSP